MRHPNPHAFDPGTATIVESRKRALVFTDAPYVCVTIPGIAFPNPLNGSHRHWRTTAAEGKRQRAAVELALLGVSDATWQHLSAGCDVTITRLSSGTVSEEAIAATLKRVRDVVAVKLFGGTLGQRDDDKRATWKYGQLKTQRGVKGCIVSVKRRMEDVV